MARKKSHGGNGHKHTSKAKRKARDIKRSEEKRGMSSKKAKHVAWATVHKDMPHKKREK